MGAASAAEATNVTTNNNREPAANHLPVYPDHSFVTGPERGFGERFMEIWRDEGERANLPARVVNNVGDMARLLLLSGLAPSILQGQENGDGLFDSDNSLEMIGRGAYNSLVDTVDGTLNLSLKAFGGPLLNHFFEDGVDLSPYKADIPEHGQLEAGIGEFLTGIGAVEALAAKLGGKVLGKLDGVLDFVPNKNTFSPIGELGEFETLGLPAITPTRNVLTDSIEGRLLVRQYKQAGMSEFQALRFARRDIESGTALPDIGLQNAGDTFYRLVPSGNEPGRSSYYLSPGQYSALKSGAADVFDGLSLPDNRFANVYDVYQYSVKQGSAPLSFSSEIAPSMSAGHGLRTGGFGQTVIPNSNALELKGLIETLNHTR